MQAVGVQPPDPSHVPERLDRWSVEQEGLPQDSPAWVWHANPLAAQRPLFPQGGESVQATAQHTLLTQWPFAQSPSTVHAAPFDLRQLPFTQVLPPLQVEPSALLGFEQEPVAWSQVPTWHWSLAVQVTPTQ